MKQEKRLYSIDIGKPGSNGTLGLPDIGIYSDKKRLVYAPSSETIDDVPKKLEFVKDSYPSVIVKGLWKGVRKGMPIKGISSTAKKVVVKYFFDNSDVGASIASDPGGYKALHLLYLDDPSSNLDRWIHERRASRGTKIRQKEYKRLLKDSILEAYGNGKVNIIDLFSGPALGPQEVIEELALSGADINKFELTAVDKKPEALDAGKKIAQDKGLSGIVKFKEYDVRGVSEREPHGSFHVAGTHGGNDYLKDEELVKLLKDTGKILVPGGNIVTTNMTHHDDSFTRFLMEYFGGWKIIYRNPREFEQRIMESRIYDIETSIIADASEPIEFPGGIPEDIKEPNGFHILVKGRKNHL